MSKKKLRPAVPFHQQPAQPKLQAYEVLKGLTYHCNASRAEVGEIVTDLPADSIAWLLEQGCIKPVDASRAEVGEIVTDLPADEVEIDGFRSR